MNIRDIQQHTGEYTAGTGERPSMLINRILKRIIPNSLIRRKLSTRAGKRILFTFDDGPTTSITPQVLDILDRYQVKGVFFVVGTRIEKCPEVLKEVHERGHLIGNHTYQHAMNPILRPAEYRADIHKCQEIIKSEIGITPALFRPPGGHISISGLLTARRLGLNSLFWSNDAGENSFNKNLNARQITDILIMQLKERDIILLHDDYKDTPQILENLLIHINNQKKFSVDGLEYIGI